MANDFSSKQIRVSQIIASGGIAGFPGSSPGLIVYSASNASDLSGGIPAALVSDFASDVFVFISGSKDGVSRGEGVTLFGGDVVVSGTLYAEKQVIEVDENVTGSLTVQGILFVSSSADIAGGLTVNKDLGGTVGDGFVAKGSGENKELLRAHPHLEQVLILSGGSDKSYDESTGADVAFYISGSVGKKGDAFVKGASLFGGDLVVSGGLYVNVSGGDRGDVIIESDNDSHMFFVSASSNTVGIGTNAPSSATKLHIGNSSDSGAERTILMLENEYGGSALDAQITFAKGGTAKHCIGMDDSDSDKFKISTGGTLGAGVSLIDFPAEVDSTGIVFNEAGVDVDVRVESDNKTHAFFVDAGADQVLILSGGDDKAYNEASGGDVSFYVSGSIDSRGGSQKGTSVFGGDLYVSGNLYSDELTVADDLTVGDQLDVGGSLFVAEYIKHSGDINTTVRFESDKITIAAGGTDLIKADKNENTITMNPDNGAISTLINGANKIGIAVDGAADRVLILSGGAAPSFDEATAVDVSLYISGAVGDRGNPAVRGTTVFGGDTFISGTLIVSGGVSDKGSWGTISGSIFETSDGLSYITAGANVVVTSGSNGQIEISATGEIDGSGGANRVAYWSDSDTLTSDAGFTFDGSTLVLNDSAVFNEMGGNSNSFRVESLNRQYAFAVEPAINQVLILSGGSDKSSQESSGADVAFYVSGSVGKRGNPVERGASVFGGDLYVSGVFHSSQGISGSITNLSDGTSYISAGANIIVTSASNGQISIAGASGTPGGSDTQLQFNDDGAFGGISTVTTDGSVVAFGDNAISVGENITHAGDTDTQIIFQTDTIRLKAGGKDLLSIVEDESTISFNTDNNAINTIIQTDTKLAFAAGTPLGAGKDQVLIMSGGAATSFNEAAQNDVLVYVSGSRTQIGGEGSGTTGRHTGDRTNTVFGGDVVFSGSIYGAGTIDPFGTTALHLAANVLQVDAQTQIALCDNNGGAPGFGPANATDTFFSVSGSIGSINSPTVKGAAVFGGDGVISGSFRTGGQLHLTTHKLAYGDTTARFARFDSNGGDASAGGNNKMVTPYGGRLIKVIARGSSVGGSTVIGFHRNTDGNANLDGTTTEDITVNMSSANTSYTFNFTGTSNWAGGDIVGIKINPTSDPGTVIATAVWEFDNIQ